MRLLNHAEQVLVLTDLDVVWHRLLLCRRQFLATLELLTLICIELVIPIDWLLAEITQVSLPSDHTVGVLDNVGSFFTREVLLSSEKVIPQEKVDWQAATQVFQLSLLALALWDISRVVLIRLVPLFVPLALLKGISFLARVKRIKNVDDACSLISRYPQAALFVASQPGHDLCGSVRTFLISFTL